MTVDGDGIEGVQLHEAGEIPPGGNGKQTHDAFHFAFLLKQNTQCKDRNQTFGEQKQQRKNNTFFYAFVIGALDMISNFQSNFS